MNPLSERPIRIDRKGKYYTSVVSTNRLRVLLRLVSGELVEGHVHVRPNYRLSDELNDDNQFISITGVQLSIDGKLLYESSFIAVHRQAIQWVIPQEAIGQPEEEEELEDA